MLMLLWRYDVIKKCVLTYGQSKTRGIFSIIETVSCGNDPVWGKNGASTPNRAFMPIEVQQHLPGPRPSLSVCAPYNSEAGRSGAGLSDATLHVPYGGREPV